MTIERQWIEIMKNEVPEAFADEMQFEPTSGFIDAQIKLMGLSEGMTWDQFLFRQFVLPVDAIVTRGATTVVLAFDDYALVPRAKAITQAKRRLACGEPLAYEEGDPFPDTPPSPWASAMANRTFKSAVVQWIVQNLPSKLGLVEREFTLLVDWKGDVLTRMTVVGRQVTVSCEPRQEPEGEADIKFARWSRRLPEGLAVDAIDGDFVPIALATHAPRVSILRYKVLGDKGRDYEWVDIDKLQAGMCCCLMSIAKLRGVTSHVWENWHVDCLIALIALSGTDYSRGTPQVGARKVWAMANRLVPILVEECFVNRRLVPEVAAERLFAEIYAGAFSKHCASTSCFDAVMGSIKASKLSDRTKASLPSFGRAVCTIKNANFILEYWNGHRPDSMKPQYGFRDVDGRVVWDDE